MTIRFTIFGPPRTKKNSQQIVFPGRGYDAWLNSVATWLKCGKTWEKPRVPFVRVIPSEAYQEWHNKAMTQVPILRTLARDQGAELPIQGPVGIKALFYRDADQGDWQGYVDGLADFLQVSKVNKHGKTTRNGAGIIVDDKQVDNWDGTRRRIDRANPRIEVEITVLQEQQTSLPLTVEEPVANDALEVFE